MSWHDDPDADEYGEHRPARERKTPLQLARRAAGAAGLVAGIVVLVVGAIFAVNVIGMAANPGGFAAPPAYGSNMALPPMAGQSQQQKLDAPLDGSTATSEDASGLSGSELAPAPMASIDPEWIASIASATGIPGRALSAYALAHVMITESDAECGLDWATIAAIGAIESDHGSHGDTVLDEQGNTRPAIIGPALDGNGVASIEDTDGGLLDADTNWDRAVGPMQFIPSTWAKWASDANGDDVSDPHQIDDAALATARYLCASGPMISAETWRAAVFSYNHDNDYVDHVARVANEFAGAAG